MAKKIVNNFTFYLIFALIVFLPFSSWIVSLTGISLLALIRDFIIILIFVLSLFFLRKKHLRNAPILLGAMFVLILVISYFWREASPLQWLRGARFLVMPVIFFLSLSFLNINNNQQKILTKTALLVSLPILILAVLEYFGLKVPLTTSLSGPGALEQTHYVGATDVTRLQSVLAGPNALALYLLAITSFFLGNFKKLYIVPTILAVLVLFLTFSRSALIGLICVGLWAFGSYLWKKGQAKLFWSFFSIFIVLGIAGMFLALKVPKLSQFVTHDSSSSIRLDQYERVWDTKEEIGLLGRGTGTAGLASQNRLDGGPNHFTENTYLDIFEELGLIGLLIYLALISLITVQAYKKSKTAFLLLLGFAATGLFINYYTGQVGLYLMWLGVALMPKERDE